MGNKYGDMLDSAFGEYYEKFRALNALTKETAVTTEELFPDGQTLVDADRMHKMLSAGIVKRVGVNKYWLNEKMASDSKEVLKQRLLVVAAGIVLGIVLVLLKKFGIF
ncbi:MAG: hypothetical protein E7491_04575 [Ruminococcaceae bacterium]|nr:hypothetical protein [Oscillospiraceae bacterium]